MTTEIAIHRPCELVAAYAADPDHAPDWYVHIKAVDWRTPKPLRVGSLIAFQADFLGRRLAYVYEIVEYVQGRRLVMRTADGPFPMETTYTWEATGDSSTKMTLRNRGKPAGFSSIVSPFMGWMMKRANAKDLRRIKQLLERRSN